MKQASWGSCSLRCTAVALRVNGEPAPEWATADML
jgi:hypothetical protein